MPISARVQVVAGIVEDARDCVLLAERPAGKRLAGMWEFPGGKIEHGESPEAALMRELKEELYLEVSVGENLGVFDFDYDWGPIALHVFVVRPLSEPRPSADVQVFEWVSVSKVSGYRLAPADVRPWSCYLALRATSRPTTETV